MNWAVVGVLGGLIVIPLTVWGLWYTARGQAREQARARNQELQDKYNEGVIAGKAIVAPDVNLAMSERDDARRERDNLQRLLEARDRRIEILEDQLRGNH